MTSLSSPADTLKLLLPGGVAKKFGLMVVSAPKTHSISTFATESALLRRALSDRHNLKVIPAIMQC